MSETKGKGTIYLVDAYALIFQVFHAIREMTGPTGLPTNALFGFTRDLLFLHQEKKPEYLVCVFDGEQPTFRSEIFPEYKANRTEMPETLRVQLPHLQELLQAMHIPMVVEEGYEADDVIATLATKAAEKGLEVFICSSDKDCRQLIGEKIRIYNLRKHAVLDRAELQRDWGVTPEQVIDLQALVGDSVDNIPGVPGIGVKTAAKLLQEYQTLDNLLENIDRLTGKRRQNLQATAGILDRNRQLVKLNTDVPMKLDWESWRRQPLDGPKLLRLFREWGFHRFADQVQEVTGGSEHTTLRQDRIKSGKNSQPLADDLFAPRSAVENNGRGSSALQVAGDEAAGGSFETEWECDYRLVEDESKFEHFIGQLQQQSSFVFDLETTGLEARRADLVGIAVCWKTGEAHYLPVRGPKGAAILDLDSTLEKLKPIIVNPQIKKRNQNIKYDQIVLRQHGVEVNGIAGDPMIADYLLNAGERNHGLQNLARNYLHHEVIPITDLIGKKGPKQKGMDEVDTAKVAEYAGEDADVAWRLCHLLEAKLEQNNLKGLYDDLEIPLIEVLAELEYNGIRLDVPRLQELGKRLGDKINELEQQIYASAAEEFNIASLVQLRRVLFEKLKLPVRRKTGITGAASTDQETLEWLAAQGHEIPQTLLEHRRLTKLKGTYIDTLPDLVNPDTGRIHASFHQTVAATGRLSSSDPNLQNIPIRSDVGGQIRQAFIPADGWVLLTADYSQIELRLLAHFADDPVLLQAFQEDRDVHSLVASQIYGVPESEVTSEMRRMAKTVNFGVIYGMSAHGLSQRLQIDRQEAESFIDSYFHRYPKVLAYQDQLLKRCREHGYVSTILGRRRSFEGEVIRPGSTSQQRNQAEREAINMEIQGSAADLIKVAMLNIFRRLRNESWQTKMLLQIHDELVFETPPEEVSSAAPMIMEEMTGALGDRLNVPLKVEIAAGSNWLDAEPLMS